MRGEFCICQAIKWNEKLRAMICNYYGVPPSEPDDVFREFRDDDRLLSIASDLGCDVTEVFLKTRDYLAQQMGVTTTAPLPSLRPADIGLLFNVEIVGQVAQILHCENTTLAVMQALFDKRLLSTILLRAGLLEPGDNLSPDSMLWRLLSHEGTQQVIRYFGGPNDIWAILTSLLNKDAARTLSEKLECAKEEIFSVLASTQLERETLAAPPSATSEFGQKFDTMAVARLQEMLRILAETYLRDARTEAEELEKRTSATGVAVALLSAIDYWGRHAYRSALDHLTTLTGAISTIVSCEICGATPGYDPKMLLRCDPPERIAGRYEVTVAYQGNPDQPYRALLRLTGSDPDVLSHVAENIPRSVSELNSLSPSLSERILRHEIPLPPTPEMKLWQLLFKSGSSLVHYFVLSGHALPDPCNLKKIIGEAHESFETIVHDSRTECPAPDAIYKRVLEQYRAAPEQE